MTGAMLGGRYALDELLGRGGMAEVYRARDTLLNRDVAVKVFRHVETSGPDSDARRTAEVQLLAGLSHPGLVTVFDAGRGADAPGDAFAYLVMEYVEGTTLRRRLDLGAMPPAEAARIGERLAEALGYVHDRGIVHRDVKPANILLTSDGTPKLTDFGVARLLDSARLTMAGATVGTANYLSPEQATGGVLTGASDIYSLGLVLLECLTGEVAYPGHGVEAAVVRLHRPPEIPAALGAGWVGLLTAMTDPDPNLRPDAPAVAAALRGLGAGGVTDATTQLLTPVAPPPNRRVLWIAAAALAVIGFAAVLALMYGGRSPSAGSGTTPSVPPSSSTTPTSTSRATSPTVISRTSSASSAPTPSKPPKGHSEPPKHDKGHKPKK